MIQPKRSIVMFLHALAPFVVLICVSCGGGKQSEEATADSTMIEFEPNDSNVVADSAATVQFTTFCCSNHTPVHCGTTTELEGLAKAHGCKDFITP